MASIDSWWMCEGFYVVGGLACADDLFILQKR